MVCILPEEHGGIPIEYDLFLSVRRINGTRRYIIAKWNETRDEPWMKAELAELKK